MESKGFSILIAYAHVFEVPSSLFQSSKYVQIRCLPGKQVWYEQDPRGRYIKLKFLLQQSLLKDQ